MSTTISQREVERRYKLIEKAYGISEEPGFGRINCYHCTNCKKITKTYDKDRGVTPAFMACSCGHRSVSSWYKDLDPDVKATHEWFRPTLQETLKLRKKPALLEHILNGGLEIRPIPAASLESYILSQSAPSGENSTL